MNLTDNASRVSCSECAPQLWIWMYWVLVNNDSHLKCVRPNGGITEKQRANGTRTHTQFQWGKRRTKIKDEDKQNWKTESRKKNFHSFKSQRINETRSSGKVSKLEWIFQGIFKRAVSPIWSECIASVEWIVCEYWNWQLINVWIS